MKIERLNADFGNSTCNFLVDSYYFEIPTNVVEVSKEKAESLITNTIDGVEDLLDRLLISTTINDEERYFIVGKLAEENPMANTHVGKMHDKITSPIPYAIFSAAVLYYYRVKNPNGENVAEIEAEAMKMMLPIWILKKEKKFSIAQTKMAERFEGQHRITLLTPGMETELTIQVKNSKCYIESEVGRWALKYKMVKKDDVTEIVKRPEARKFDDTETVFVDIGGGSTDAVLLTKGLNTPVSKDSFQVIQINPFLGELEKLLKEKLIIQFKDLRSLEKFLVDNHYNQKYVLKNPNTGQREDLTEPIVEMLEEYAKLLEFKVTEAYNSNTNRKKYVYFGGETPILTPYIKEVIKNMTSEEILESNHFFLNELLEEDNSEIFQPTARTINIAALEILSQNERKSTQE